MGTRSSWRQGLRAPTTAMSVALLVCVVVVKKKYQVVAVLLALKQMYLYV
jgi:hypothetical protein